jgi:stage II sporulation protein D
LTAWIVTAALGFSLSAQASQVMRVAVSKGTRSIQMTGVDLTVKDGAGRRLTLPREFNRQKISFKATKGGIAANDYLIPTEHLIVRSPSVYYRLGRRQYRGEMHIWNEGGRLLAVNHIDLEEYLVGLINHEINSEWPEEAVKAQVVVARTYALYQAGNARDGRYDLESTVQDQVYGGAQTEDWRSARAVRATAGEVLVTRDGEIIQAHYHSCCGGKTELPENVWGRKTAVRRTVKDPFCKTAPNFNWSYTLEPAEFGRRLRKNGKPGGYVTLVKVLSRTTNNRAMRVRVETTEGATTLTGNELRRVLGYSKLKSATFKVTADNGSFVFRGTGAGHGVGMCQWGAKGMGDAGKYSYRQILGFYYPGLYIRNLYKAGRRHAGR